MDKPKFNAEQADVLRRLLQGDILTYGFLQTYAWRTVTYAKGWATHWFGPGPGGPACNGLRQRGFITVDLGAVTLTDTGRAAAQALEEESHATNG